MSFTRRSEDTGRRKEMVALKREFEDALVMLQEEAREEEEEDSDDDAHD